MKNLLKLIIITTALTLPTIGVISAKTDDLGLSNLTDEELAQIEALIELELHTEGAVALPEVNMLHPHCDDPHLCS